MAKRVSASWWVFPGGALLAVAERMPLRRFAWSLLLVGACSAESSPVLDSARVEGDMLYATYRGVCGQARLAWGGSVNRSRHEALLALSYTDRGERHCTREIAFDLAPIRAAFPEAGPSSTEVRVLVPSDLDNVSFTPVSYVPEQPRECSRLSGAMFPESTAADGFATISGLELQSCGREWVSVGSSCCEHRTAGYDCLIRALETCNPTRFGEGYGTSAGAPILTDYFVMPTKSGCELVVMADYSLDAWKDEDGEVQTTYCASASLGIKASGECPDLVLDDCGL